MPETAAIATASPSAHTERRIRLASVLVCLGLLVLLLTRVRIHLLAVVAFTVIGCPLLLAGILLFLIQLCPMRRRRDGAHRYLVLRRRVLRPSVARVGLSDRQSLAGF